MGDEVEGKIVARRNNLGERHKMSEIFGDKQRLEHCGESLVDTAVDEQTRSKALD